MSLKSPCAEDLRKVHAEITQIVNQRFLITTFAITVFGLIVAWLIPKNTPPVGSDLGLFTFAGSILLILLLLGLYWYSHSLKGMLRIFTSYLLVTEASAWEYDWERYRRTKYFGFTKAQTSIFLLLGILATSFPCFLAGVYSLNLRPQIGLWVDIGVGIIYFVLVLGMGFLGFLNPEPKAKEKWEKLRKEEGAIE